MSWFASHLYCSRRYLFLMPLSACCSPSSSATTPTASPWLLAGWLAGWLGLSGDCHRIVGAGGRRFIVGVPLLSAARVAHPHSANPSDVGHSGDE